MAPKPSRDDRAPRGRRGNELGRIWARIRKGAEEAALAFVIAIVVSVGAFLALVGLLVHVTDRDLERPEGAKR